MSRLLLLLTILALLAAAVLFTATPAGAQQGGDLVEVRVSLETMDLSVAEGGTTSIAVRLSDDPGRELEIPITVTPLGGATTADYSDVPSSVTFGIEEIYEGKVYYETRVRFRPRAVLDNLDDDGEAVRIGIGSPLPPGVRLGRPSEVTVRIRDGVEVLMGLAQVGMGVTAAPFVSERFSNETWQWQRSATEYGTYADIPAAEGGTSNPYTPAADDLGMWLKVKVTYDEAGVSQVGLTSEGYSLLPVLSQPVLSNAGFDHSAARNYAIPASTPHLFAQPFTTGADTRGYLLRGVRFMMILNPPDTAAGTWGVHADDGGKPAAEPLSGSAPIRDADVPRTVETYQEFTHPGGVRLDASTKYWIVLSQTTPLDEGFFYFGGWGEWDSSGFLGFVHEPLETPPMDPGGEAGWSVDFQLLNYHDVDKHDDDTPDLALLPWELAGVGLELAGRFVLRFSLLVAPDVTVEFGAADYTADEGGTASVEVTLSGDPRRTVTVPITAMGQGGATTTDYSASSTVTFHAGETSKTITFTAVDDEDDDDDESVRLAFGTMPDAWIATGTTTETTVAINDDDDPRVTVTFEQHSYSVAEGAMQEVMVNLSADPERELIIPITATARDGASSTDYSMSTTSVTFASGATSTTFTFTATDDDVDDDDESVLLEFGTMPDGRVSRGQFAEAAVEIVDDDHPPVSVQFGQDFQRVGEGDTVNVTIRLSAEPERMVSIPITSTPQGTASTTDYDVPTSVVFNEGETEKTIAFMAVDDEVDDDDESVKLGFGTPLPDRVTLGARTETRLDINDDDPPIVTVMFAQSAFTVAEGGTQTVTVRLNADPERTLIIPITATLQGTASAADYSGVEPSVTFNTGATSTTFTFEAIDDQIDDDGESVKLGFGTMPDERVSSGTPGELTLSIDDDDTADVVLSPSPLLTVEEEDSADYTVVLATEPTVDVTVTVSGHSGTDLSLESGRLVNDSLTFTPVNWHRPQTVSVSAAHDDDGVADTATLTHTAAGAEYADSESDLEVTVNDNDPLGIVLTPLALTVHESDSAPYTVSLATEPTVSVTLTITGHAGTDLTLGGPDITGHALTFTAANWSDPQTVTVAAGHDEDHEDDTATLTHTARGGEYELLYEALPVTVDDNTGDLRLVDGVMTDEDGNPCEGRLEIYYDGEWGTICDDYWTEGDADVACRALGFAGGSVEEWDRFRSSFFPSGQETQPIWLDDMLCSGGESNLLDCRSGHTQVGRNNCRHPEDVGLRCLKNTGPYIVRVEFSEAPGGDSSYDEGETVEVRLVWSEPVTLSTTPNGYPRLWLSYGGQGGTWLYHPTGSGTDRIVYTHTLQALGGATSSSYLAVGHDSLTLRNPDLVVPTAGSILSMESGAPAIVGLRTYRSSEPGATVAVSTEQVEATTIVGVPALNEPGEDGVFGPGETVEVTFTFSQAVDVDTASGAPSAPVLLSGTTAKQALYLRGSGTARLVFGYTLIAGDGEHSSLLVEPNTLALNGGSIRDGTGNDADISHQGAGAFFAPAPDVDAPQLRSVTVDGSSLTLTYDEDLDSSGFLSTGLFAVTVNGASRSVMGAGVGGPKVILLLSPAVEAGDTVIVDYIAPTEEGVARVQDSSGNAAESFSGQEVTNGTLSTDATLSSLSLSGIDISTFSSGTSTNSASVAHDVSSTTVTASATHDGASVTIADAGGSTQGTSRTVSLSSGDNEITVTVTAEDGTTTGVYTVTVTRADPVVPAVTIVAGASPVTEGTAASFTVSLDGEAPVELSVAVDLSDPGGVLSGTASTSVAFAVGDSSETKTLSTKDDDVIEATSTVTVFLASGIGYTLGTTTSASVQVADNDSATWTVSALPAEMSEGASSTVTVAISNGKTFSTDRTITLTVTGTATGTDYTLSESGLTLDKGTSSVSATVTATGDDEEEGDESVIVSASHDGQSIGSATVTILANDARMNLLDVADFDSSGLETVVLASFDAGGDTTLYAASESRWGGSGSLVEGDVNLDDDTRILRVMLPNSDGSLLRLNDHGGLILSDFFGQAGAGADLTVTVRTSAGTASFAASDVMSAGSNYVNFNVPSSDRSILTGIGDGARFLLALTRPAPNTAAQGDPTVTDTARVGRV